MTNISNSSTISRPDFVAIAALVKSGAKVLDLGCGDGSLLRYLCNARDVHGYGVEIDDENIQACFNNGINVIQSDLESHLSHCFITPHMSDHNSASERIMCHV